MYIALIPLPIQIFKLGRNMIIQVTTRLVSHDVPMLTNLPTYMYMGSSACNIEWGYTTLLPKIRHKKLFPTFRGRRSTFQLHEHSISINSIVIMHVMTFAKDWTLFIPWFGNGCQTEVPIFWKKYGIWSKLSTTVGHYDCTTCLVVE